MKQRKLQYLLQEVATNFQAIQEAIERGEFTGEC